MPRQLLAPDRVTLLLALIPYLREHGPTPVQDLAETFGVAPDVLRKLVEFLATAGVPGETLSYQHEDLFDIDWDAFEHQDIVSLTRVVVVDEPIRFAPLETAALIAGLQSLMAVLPADEGELARATAEKLGRARDDREASPPSVSGDPDDPQLSVIVAALQHERALAFDYRSVAGDQTSRTVDPQSLYQADGAWYLRAYCRDRRGERVFRVDQMRAARHSGALHDAPIDTKAAARIGQAEIVATLPVSRLPLIAGFAPEVVEHLPDDAVRVRIVSWHDGSAVRLVQQAGGSATIEQPESARTAVRDWAQRALAAYDPHPGGINWPDGG